MSGAEAVPIVVFGVVVFLVAAGGFCVGYHLRSKEVLKWRVKWIIHEHTLARLQDRDPMNIDEFEKQDKD
jgi:hypothetical protein